MKRQRRFIQNTAVISGSILLLLVLLEIGLRVWFTYFADDVYYLRYVASAEEISARTARISGLPYLNFGLSSDYPGHNSLGYRGAEFSLEKPAGVYRIVAVGGSTTYGEFITQAEDAYPPQLERILREAYSYEHVEVINAGVPGYGSWEIFINFSFRVLELEPDLIVYYEAINDVWPRLADPAFYTGLNPGRGIWQVDSPALPPSVLYRYLAINLGWLPAPGTIEGRIQPTPDHQRCAITTRGGQDYCAGMNITPEARLAENPPVYLERNLRNLVAVARENGVDVLFSTWAYSPERFDHPGGDYVSHAFMQGAIAEHNDVIQRVAAETDSLLYDFAADLQPSRDWWVDGYHFSVDGAREQARLYAEFLHSRGVITATR